MPANLRSALGIAIVLVSTTLAFSKEVTVYDIEDGARCLDANMMPSSGDTERPQFPVSAERTGLNTIRIGNCYYDISEVVFDKPPPCPKVPRVSPGTSGGIRGPDGKRCTP
jgi:hypothetical protein